MKRSFLNFWIISSMVSLGTFPQNLEAQSETSFTCATYLDAVKVYGNARASGTMKYVNGYFLERTAPVHFTKNIEAATAMDATFSRIPISKLENTAWTLICESNLFNVTHARIFDWDPEGVILRDSTEAQNFLFGQAEPAEEGIPSRNIELDFQHEGLGPRPTFVAYLYEYLEHPDPTFMQASPPSIQNGFFPFYFCYWNLSDENIATCEFWRDKSRASQEFDVKYLIFRKIID